MFFMEKNCFFLAKKTCAHSLKFTGKIELKTLIYKTVLTTNMRHVYIKSAVTVILYLEG